MTDERAMEFGRRAWMAEYRLTAGGLWQGGACCLACHLDTTIPYSVKGPYRFTEDDLPGGGEQMIPEVGAWPDFRDAATLGTLVAQVREALSMPDLVIRVCRVRTDSTPAVTVSVIPQPRTAQEREYDRRITAVNPTTEIEAWVSALEHIHGGTT